MSAGAASCRVSKSEASNIVAEVDGNLVRKEGSFDPCSVCPTRSTFAGCLVEAACEGLFKVPDAT
jgi:hypothetical protein